MLRHLRKLPPNAKRKFSAFIAGVITLLIFAAWLLHSAGAFASIYQSGRDQGIAIFSFFNQNVETAYDAYEARFGQAPQTIETEASTTAATTTEESTASTTIIATSTASRGINATTTTTTTKR